MAITSPMPAFKGQLIRGHNAKEIKNISDMETASRDREKKVLQVKHGTKCQASRVFEGWSLSL